MPLFKIYIIFRYIMKSRLSFKKLFLPVPFPGAILYHPFFLIILFLVLRFSLDAFPCWTSHINFFLFEAFFGHHQILRVDLYSSVGKSSACNVGDLGLIPGLGRSSGEGNGNPLQYSGLENSMDCIRHRVSKSQTWLGDFHWTYSAPEAFNSIYLYNVSDGHNLDLASAFT